MRSTIAFYERTLQKHPAVSSQPHVVSLTKPNRAKEGKVFMKTGHGLGWGVEMAVVKGQEQAAVQMAGR